MQAKTQKFRIILYIAVAIAVTFAPLVINVLHQEVDPLAPMKQETPAWTGVVELWNICYVKASKSSQVAWLEKNAIEPFEFANQGFFIRVRSVEPKSVNYEIQVAQNANNLPEMIAVPNNGIEVGETIAFENAAEVLVDCPIKKSIQLDEYTIPWCSGGFVYMTNERLCHENNMEFVATETLFMQPDQYVGAKKASPFVIVEDVNYQLKEQLPTGAVTDYIVAKENELYGIFLKQNKAIGGLVPLRTYFMAESLQSQGKIDPFKSQLAPEWIKNTQICRMGLLKQENLEKRQMCINFLQYLLSSDVQQELGRLGMFSVRDDIIIYDTGLLSQMEIQQGANQQITEMEEQIIE